MILSVDTMPEGVKSLAHCQPETAIEVKHLEETIAVAKEQLSNLRQRNEEYKTAIMEAKKELREDTSHAISNLWSQDNFLDLVNLSQYANQVADRLSEYDLQARKVQALEKLINSPYFARINFKFDGEREFEKVYIGRSSLQDEESYEMLVYDWRSPIASIFYRFTTGEANYDAPGGKITGQVNLKRQYEIQRGKLEYYFDADVQIIDEFLRKLLSQNASAQMKTIVETIQKEQDMIIRDMEVDLMMVQGAAGSGKTSVALHRAAYLMYQGLAERLSHNNIVIISPNTIFERYIANVLPELGENQVNSLIYEEILYEILQREDIETRNQFLENLLLSRESAEVTMRKNAMKFKGSREFAEILRRFIADVPKSQLPISDIYYDGKLIATRQSLKDKLLKGDPGLSLASRLLHLEHSILKSIHKLRKGRLEKLRNFIAQKPEHEFEIEEMARMLSIQESTVLIKNIRKFTELNYLELYRKLFADKKYFYRLARGLKLPDCIDEIIDSTRKNLQRKELQLDDALPLAYVHLMAKGNKEAKAIKQVVIDEAQDYHPIHFEILKELFPKARYTILGDINQTIGKQEDLSLYHQVSQILNKENSTLVTLAKSFRCTQDILEYSKQFLSSGFQFDSFSRKGEAPTIYTATSQADLDELITKEIMTCQEMNYQSIGIICKTEYDAGTLYERLKSRISIQLINRDTEAALQGVFIIPVYLSKGLEFDAVLIWGVDQDHYHSDDDKNLLYIACTRALHRLSLFYTGEISPLLQSK